MFATRRSERSHRKGPLCVVHKVPYKCSWGFPGARHSKGAEIERRRNPEIKAELIEGRVLAMVGDVMLHPAKLRECMEHFR